MHHLLGIDCMKTLLTHPKIGASWERNALEDLGLKHVLVIYPGTRRFPLSDQVEAIPFHAVTKGVSLSETREV